MSSVLTKLSRSFGERGVLGTLKYVPERVVATARARYDQKFDKAFGVDTAGVTPLSDLVIESGNRSAGIRYEPISVPVLRHILRRLPADHSKYTFIDYGSGKGRVLLIAAEWPFKRIIGVEFAPELHQAAVKNITAYSNPHQRSHQIESLCMDAIAFEPPDEPLVCFFYSPFRRQVLEPVLDRLRASFESRPRAGVLIFHGANPESIQLFRDRWPSLTELSLPRDWTRRRRDRYPTNVVRIGHAE